MHGNGFWGNCWTFRPLKDFRFPGGFFSSSFRLLFFAFVVSVLSVVMLLNNALWYSYGVSCLLNLKGSSVVFRSNCVLRIIKSVFKKARLLGPLLRKGRRKFEDISVYNWLTDDSNVLSKGFYSWNWNNYIFMRERSLWDSFPRDNIRYNIE